MLSSQDLSWKQPNLIIDLSRAPAPSFSKYLESRVHQPTDRPSRSPVKATNSAFRNKPLHPFFRLQKEAQKAQRKLDEDFVVKSDSEDEDDARSSSKTKGFSKAKKSMSLLQRESDSIRIAHCPTYAEAAEKAKAADRKGKERLWPPISNLDEIYCDIVDRMPEALLKPLAQTLSGRGRALRVATMCSGTESPLLALNLISRAIESKWGIQVDIEHVFSCELEPFKQAYIERNFSPPILFRDVTELGKAKAHTAYGALVDVPGDIDLLVAGTSCVDYSGLNNAKKAMGEGGESGRTFFGMLDWVKRNRPAIVILENVKSAPWEGVSKFFEEADYVSSYSTRFDTKNYYIPQTRQRGYFFATRSRQAGYPANWLNLVTSMQRPASSPIEAFILPTNDPRIQATRAKMGHEESGKSRSTIDWSKCQGRHEEARGVEKLGQARPFTAWEEGGSCLMSHGAWNEFARPQPERVLDLLDITVLRDAAKEEDPHFKSRVWELSQNVDRNIVAPQPGITGCLTPSGMPFLTSRGGPVTGLEALSLQGLPINELLLTRESDDQLQDLAGNAMSSTVVGICILSALVLAKSDLEADRQHLDPGISQRLSKQTSRRGVPVTVTGEEFLSDAAQTYDLTKTALIDMPDLLARAARSSQLCICEGETLSKRQIYRCTSCDHTACDTCISRPSHTVELFSMASEGHRDAPRIFEDHLKEALPMRMVLNGQNNPFDVVALEAVAAGIDGLSGQTSQWKRWAERVSAVLEGAEFHFCRLLRRRCWTAEFVAPSARLELVLEQTSPRWQLFVEPEKAEPEGSMLRKLLLQPVARQLLDCHKERVTLLEAGTPWEVNLPVRLVTTATITSHGEQIDSWQSSLGLRGAWMGTKRYSEMRVEIPDRQAVAALGADDVSGNFKLLPQCGQANASLHKLQGQTADKQPLYFFIDAALHGAARDDSYVFSRHLGLMDYPQERCIIAKAKAGWKPHLAPRDLTVADELEVTPEELENLSSKYHIEKAKHAGKTHEVELTICGKWVAMSHLQLRVWSASLGTSDDTQRSTISVPQEPLVLDLDRTSCDSASTVLLCTTPLSGSTTGDVWPRTRDIWVSVDLEHEGRETFTRLAWLIERIPEVKAWQRWMSARLSCTEGKSSCPNCAPAAPTIQWLKKGAAPPMPIENEQEAGPFEQALKNRPFAFLVHLMRNSSDIAHLRVAVNAATLMHRALSRLPPRSEMQQTDLSWRLTRLDPALTQFNLPAYTLSSNRHDAEADSPKTFKLELRKEQKRSLTWMLAQESECVTPFVEEEVSEALLPALEWCAEGRARRERTVCGGVIADAVGYGKTAISLALIAAQKERERERPVAPANDGLIATKATLVIVPPQLCKQWENEVGKFLGSKMSVHVIFSKADLNRTTIEMLQEADIVIMSVSVYKSDSYFDSLAAFAAANPIPGKEGRFFESALGKSVSSLPDRVKELKLSDRGRTLWQSIKERKDFDPTHLTTFKAQKRMLGAQYAREKALEDIVVNSEKSNAETIEDAWAAIKKQKIADVWGLKAGLKRWTDLTSPPLEAFSWRRVIIDEFHYIAAEAGRVFSAVRSLTGSATWVLSGTPKIGDFADIRNMAAFLNIHLGVEDDADYADSSTRSRSARNKVRSGMERFRSFVEVHSPAWHHRRQALAQSFLDRFVRQNVAEIDEIASVEILKPVRMPAAERACYLELQHTIEALDLRHARSLFRGSAKAKALVSENDRDNRLRTMLGESSSPEEALSRQAAHFVLSTREKAKNAIEACDLIVAERASQLEHCKAELIDRLAAAKEQHFLMALHYGYRDESKQALVSFAKNAISAKYGDKDSKHDIARILQQTACNEKDLTVSQGRKLYGGSELREALKRRAIASAIAEVRKQRVLAAKRVPQGKGGMKKAAKKPILSDSDESLDSEEESGGAKKAHEAEERKAAAKAVKDVEIMLGSKKKQSDEEKQRQAWLQETHARALVHHLVQLRNETAARQRSLRYFENIRTIQLSQGRSISGVCPSCRTQLSFEDLALSSVCGHLFCEGCGRRDAWKGKCPESSCNADAKPSAIVTATSLGIENEEVSAFGEKMSQLANLLRNETLIPEDDKVILFVQFESLLQKTAHALSSYGVKYTRVKGNARQRSQTLDDYQRGIAPRVLLLDVADESAAGSNLTIANHVIFLSSLVTEDQASYRSTLQQARGRCIRFGQTKEVHVWQLLARSTIDEEIFNKRAGLGTLDQELDGRTQRQKDLGKRLGTVKSVEDEASAKKRMMDIHCEDSANGIDVDSDEGEKE